MKVKIEFYGRLKAAFTDQYIDYEINRPDTDVTIEDVFKDLCKQYLFHANTQVIRPINNDTFANWSDAVKADDVIGFFPPASGG